MLNLNPRDQMKMSKRLYLEVLDEVARRDIVALPDETYVDDVDDVDTGDVGDVDDVDDADVDGAGEVKRVVRDSLTFVQKYGHVEDWSPEMVWNLHYPDRDAKYICKRWPNAPAGEIVDALFRSAQHTGWQGISAWNRYVEAAKQKKVLDAAHAPAAAPAAPAEPDLRDIIRDIVREELRSLLFRPRIRALESRLEKVEDFCRSIEESLQIDWE